MIYQFYQTSLQFFNNYESLTILGQSNFSLCTKPKTSYLKKLYFIYLSDLTASLAYLDNIRTARQIATIKISMQIFNYLLCITAKPDEKRLELATDVKEKIKNIPFWSSIFSSVINILK